MNFLPLLFSILGGGIAAFAMNQFMAQIGKTKDGDSVNMTKALVGFFAGLGVWLANSLAVS